MINPVELKHLIPLLDDGDEEVRTGLELALLDFEGDASDALAGSGLRLNSAQERNLSKLLRQGREIRLREEWVVPEHALDEVDGDWECFESLLKVISDFLHDGVSLRPSLPDQLDLLAEELETHCDTPLGLADALFKSGMFGGNQVGISQVENSDLAWVITERLGNPLGLALVYLLVARRLNMTVYGCNYPGHFLAMVDDGEEWLLVDCYHAGRRTRVRELLRNHPELSSSAKDSLQGPCTLRTMLCRLLANLVMAFKENERRSEAAPIADLLKALCHER